MLVNLIYKRTFILRSAIQIRPKDRSPEAESVSWQPDSREGRDNIQEEP